MKSAVGPGSVARAWAVVIAFVIVLVFLLPYPVVAKAAPVLRFLGIALLLILLALALLAALVIALDSKLADTATLKRDDER